MKLRRCQSGKKSFRSPWSPPSQLPRCAIMPMSASNVASAGVAMRNPELNASGQPLSGAAAKVWGVSKSGEMGRKTSVSASRKMILRYWLRRKRCSFVSDAARSLRPAHRAPSRQI